MNRILKKAISLIFTAILCCTISADGQQLASRLDYPINTADDDFSPSVTADGRTMVFNSRTSKDGDHNIFISTFLNGKWSAPRPLEILNTKYNEETPFINSDGTIILFSSDRPDTRNENPDDQFTGGKFTYDIYISEKLNDAWTAPVRVPGEVNTEMNERSPSLSIDKKTLFFTRYPYKYIKKSRIMKASYDNGIFVAAVELPPPVNSDSYDISMTPALNGIGYYFSSIRKGGMGGWDIYYIEYIGGKWGDANLLPAPANSAEHDLFLSETNDRVFYSSNRIRGYGGYDIYSSIKNWRFPANKNGSLFIDKSYEKKDLQPPDKNYVIKPEKKDTESVKESGDESLDKEKVSSLDTRTCVILNVKNASDDKPVSLGFTIYLKDTDDSSAPELRKITEQSDENGIIKIYPKEDVKWLVVKHTDKGFMPIRIAVKTIPGTATESAVSLYPAGPNGRVKSDFRKTSDGRLVLNPVYFSFNSSRIDLNYFPYLHRVISHMRDNPSVKIIIEGHADHRGREKHNRQISFKRAKAVKNYLVKMGVSRSRISVRGIGSAEADNGRGYDQLNRKAVIRIIDSK